MRYPTSRNFDRRWARLRDYLRCEQGIDVVRFHETIEPLGLASMRFVVTCWERLGDAGFRGALRLLLALRRAGQRLQAFVLPDERPHLQLELTGMDRRGHRVRLSRGALQASGNELQVLAARVASRAAAGGRAQPAA